jgi:hypothetical protein
MAHLHTDTERLDIHVALEVCEIVIESATPVPIVFALVGLARLCRSIPIGSIDSNAPAFSPFRTARPSRRVPAFRFIRLLFGLIEKLTHFHQHLVEFRCLHFSNRVKNEVVFKREKALWTNEARLTEFAAFTIAIIQRHGESIAVSAASDLAENQVRAWKILNYQSGPALSPGNSGSRKRNDNDFAGYRFDHAASSSVEFQSRARTDSLSSAPLNDSSCAFLFRRIAKS